MIRKVLGALGAAAVCSATLAVAPAQAASPVTVTSPSCGTIRVTNSGSTPATVGFDSGYGIDLDGRSSETLRGLPAGTYTWLWGPVDSEPTGGAASVTVARCSGGAVRPVDGDQNGDGKADVLGIQASTGNLYYYRMTSTGLASGVLAGTGWNNMVFMQQVNEIEGTDTGNYLVAVRNDGTVWRYDNKGYGRFSNGRQIHSGLTGYTNFTITSTNSLLNFGGHTLLATKGDVLYAFNLWADGLDGPYELGTGWGTTTKLIATRDFNKNKLADLVAIRKDGTMWAYEPAWIGTSVFTTPRQVGSGWGAMQTVTSPGSLDGDALSDLVARRSDGNLYKYINKGGYWGPATQIGTNWQKIRLLA